MLITLWELRVNQPAEKDQMVIIRLRKVVDLESMFDIYYLSIIIRVYVEKNV